MQQDFNEHCSLADPFAAYATAPRRTRGVVRCILELPQTIARINHQQALKGGGAEAAELRALSARYLPKPGVLEVEFSNGFSMRIASARIPGLSAVPTRALADCRVAPGGENLVFGEHSATIFLPELIACLIPAGIVRRALLQATAKPSRTGSDHEKE